MGEVMVFDRGRDIPLVTSLVRFAQCLRHGHVWSFLGYRRWPDWTVEICQRCGRKKVTDESGRDLHRRV